MQIEFEVDKTHIIGETRVDFRGHWTAVLKAQGSIHPLGVPAMSKMTLKLDAWGIPSDLIGTGVLVIRVPSQDAAEMMLSRIQLMMVVNGRLE